MNSPTNRYKLIDGSQSSHCCFEFTIVDTTKPIANLNKELVYYEEVCETFDRQSAELILNALNTNEINP